jgi:hypothetical protein
MIRKFNQTNRDIDRHKKLMSKWDGPYLIEKGTGKVIVNIRNIKRYVERPKWMMETTLISSDLPEDLDDVVVEPRNQIPISQVRTETGDTAEAREVRYETTAQDEPREPENTSLFSVTPTNSDTMDIDPGPIATAQPNRIIQETSEVERNISKAPGNIAELHPQPDGSTWRGKELVYSKDHWKT